MTTIRILSDEKDVSEIIRSAIFAEIKRLEIGLKKTEKEIREFENKYKVRTPDIGTHFCVTWSCSLTP